MDDLSDLLDNSSKSFSTISPQIVDAAGKIAQAFFTSGFNGWNTFLSREILFQAGATNYAMPAEYLTSEKESLVVTTIKWGGDRQGMMYIAIPESGVKGAVAFFLAVAMGSKADVENTKLDAEAMDAYSELANTLAGQGAQALRGEVGGKIEISVSGNNIVQTKSADLAATFGTEEMLCCAGQLIIEGLSPVSVQLLMSVSCTGIMPELKKGGKAATPEEILNTIASMPKVAVKHRNETLALRLTLPVIVALASTRKRVENVKELAPGSIIEFRKYAGEFLDINAGNTKFAEGEVVIVNQHFGIQVRRIMPQIPFAHMLRK